MRHYVKAVYLYKNQTPPPNLPLPVPKLPLPALLPLPLPLPPAASHAHKRQHRTTHHRQRHHHPPRHLHLAIPHLAARIPNQMADAVESMERERQRDAELDQRLGRGAAAGNPLRQRRRLEVPAQQRRGQVRGPEDVDPARERAARDAVQRRQVPGHLRAVDGQVRADGSVEPLGGEDGVGVGGGGWVGLGGGGGGGGLEGGGSGKGGVSGGLRLWDRWGGGGV